MIANARSSSCTASTTAQSEALPGLADRQVNASMAMPRVSLAGLRQSGAKAAATLAKARVWASALSLALLGCNATKAAEAPELILHNAKIYTVDDRQPWAQALAIDAEGRIVAVGGDAEVLALANHDTERVDLRGRLVLPGFQDTHAHVLDASSEAQGDCELSPDEAIEDWLDILADCANNQSADEDEDRGAPDWLLGSGFALHTLLEAGQTPRSLLDRIIPDRPVAIMEETSHSYWLNSEALRQADIDADSPDPAGGVIVRDAKGQPTGLLLDNAGDLAMDAALPPSRALQRTYYDAVVAGQAELARNGITSVADARVFWRRGHLEAWQKAARQDQLKARTVLGLWAYPNLQDDRQLLALKALHDDDTSDLLRITQVKFYVDGIIHNTTARLRRPYEESLPGVDRHGLYYFDPPRLARYARELSEAGFDLHLHAIGDQGVRDALDAIESTGTTGRHRITHVELVAPEDIPRFRGLNATVDFQPSAYFQKPALEEYVPAIGERAHRMLPMRAIYDSGARVTLSSDWDVNALSPLGIIQNALSLGDRSLPDLDAAVRAYTLSAAYTLRQEKETGSLEVGKLADLVVLNRNIFEMPINRIGTAKVVSTYLGGEEVFRDAAATDAP